MSKSQSSSIQHSPTPKGKTQLLTEDEIITKRVMYADDTINECIDSFFTFYDALNDNKKDRKHIGILENDLLAKLEWCQLKTRLGGQCEMTLNNDIHLYKQQLLSLQREKQSIQTNIEKLNKKLNNAKTTRDNQEEYNIMIQQILKEPPREQTTKLLEEMKTKLNEINNTLDQCKKTIETRSKQCYAAFASVQALNRSIMASNATDESLDNDNDVVMQ